MPIKLQDDDHLHQFAALLLDIVGVMTAFVHLAQQKTRQIQDLLQLGRMLQFHVACKVGNLEVGSEETK